MGLFLLFVALVSAAEVVKVTSANADVLKGPALVKFFAPWCGHCKSMAADYHTLAKEATGFTVAEVDCTEADSKALCEKHSIRGYPTLLFFKDGQSYKFNRQRKGVARGASDKAFTVQDMRDFVEKEFYLQEGVEKTAVAA